MNSLVFIRDAKLLIARMETVAQLAAGEDRDQQAKQVQDDLNYLCNNMTNPSLPSASKLVQSALRYKFALDSRVIHKVNQFS